MQQEPVAAPWKALHLAGGYGQIHYRMSWGYAAPLLTGAGALSLAFAAPGRWRAAAFQSTGNEAGCRYL